ncbi:hypothetical protein DID99_21645 [Burkholderia sp. Bp8986]|nr:hypothetical protein DID99_21645 [Burkholderia sp. Bp8986]
MVRGGRAEENRATAIVPSSWLDKARNVQDFAAGGVASGAGVGEVPRLAVGGWRLAVGGWRWAVGGGRWAVGRRR